MNELRKITITITFDTWEPFVKDLDCEIDTLLGDIRAKKLLSHAGNVKTLINEVRPSE